MTQETFERKLKQLFIGNSIETIDVYQINTIPVVIRESSQWVFDGGVQFNTKDSFFSVASDPNTAMFEYMFDQSVSDYLQEYDELPEIPSFVKERINSVCGKRITELNCHWSYAQYYIENGKLSEEKEYFPQEIQFIFEDGSILQFADVCYELDEGTNVPVNFTRGFSEDALLITLNDAILLT